MSYRNPALDTNGRLQHQKSGLFENGRLSCRSSSGSLDSMTDSAAAVAEFHNGSEETECNGPRMPVETKGFVNNRESLRMEAQLKFVNSNKEDLKMENHFEDEGGEFD